MRGESFGEGNRDPMEHGIWAGVLIGASLAVFQLVDFAAGWDSGVANTLTFCVVALVPTAGVLSAFRLREHELGHSSSTLGTTGGVAGLLAGTVAVLAFLLLQLFPGGVDGNPFYGRFSLLELILGALFVFAIPTGLVMAGFSAVASIVTGALLQPSQDTKGTGPTPPKRSLVQRKGYVMANAEENDKYVKWSLGPFKVRSKKEEIEDRGENYYRWLLGHFGRKTLRRLIAVVVIVAILFLCSFFAGMVG